MTIAEQTKHNNFIVYCLYISLNKNCQVNKQQIQTNLKLYYSFYCYSAMGF